MEYEIDKTGEQITIRITGRLTFKEHGKCRELIQALGDMDGEHEIADLTKLEFIDSAGLGLLLRLKESAETANRNLSLRVPNDGQVHKMLTVAEFEKMIPFSD